MLLDEYDSKCDQAMELYEGSADVKENGMLQSREAGKFLKSYFARLREDGERPDIQCYSSCYKRARQTLDQIVAELGEDLVKPSQRRSVAIGVFRDRMRLQTDNVHSFFFHFLFPRSALRVGTTFCLASKTLGSSKVSESLSRALIFALRIQMQRTRSRFH